MKASHKFILMVVVALVAAAVMLRPSRTEQAAVLASEGRHHEAVALLERELSLAPGDPDILAALARSYASLGDAAKAATALDEYLALRPDDLSAWDGKAELLLQGQMPDGYLDALARAVAVRPSADGITRLAALLRLHGRVEDEVSLLRSYAASDLLNVTQLERLGALVAAQGDWQEARKWLETADRDYSPDLATARFLLLEVLIEAGEVEEIDRRVRRWMTVWRSPFLCGKVILRLARADLHELVSRSAVAYADLMPEQVFDIANMLTGQSRPYIARQMLSRWAERATAPKGEQLRGFVQATGLLGDLGMSLDKLAGLIRDRADMDATSEMLDEVSLVFGGRALLAIRPFLGQDLLEKHPLFAARLNLMEGNHTQARWFLNRIEPGRLSPAQLPRWLELAQQVETDAELTQRLTVLWNSGRLPSDLMPAFARAAMQSGHAAAHDLIWSAGRR